jgi:hypothetical protein
MFKQCVHEMPSKCNIMKIYERVRESTESSQGEQIIFTDLIMRDFAFVLITRLRVLFVLP